MLNNKRVLKMLGSAIIICRYIMIAWQSSAPVYVGLTFTKLPYTFGGKDVGKNKNSKTS